jgi:hypothetical protein
MCSDRFAKCNRAIAQSERLSDSWPIFMGPIHDQAHQGTRRGKRGGGGRRVGGRQRGGRRRSAAGFALRQGLPCSATRPGAEAHAAGSAERRGMVDAEAWHGVPRQGSPRYGAPRAEGRRQATERQGRVLQAQRQAGHAERRQGRARFASLIGRLGNRRVSVIHGKLFGSPESPTNGEKRKWILPKWPCSAAHAEDRSRSRFANLVFRFANKWCYKSEEITAIFLAAAAEEEELEEDAFCGARWIGSGFANSGLRTNRHSSGRKQSTFVWKENLVSKETSEVTTAAVRRFFAPFEWLLSRKTPVDWTGSHELFVSRHLLYREDTHITTVPFASKTFDTEGTASHFFLLHSVNHMH